MQAATTFDKLKKTLTPGQVYRRAEFARLSSNVDRHLAQLVKRGDLKKVAPGMYAAPKKTAFGEAPPDEGSLLGSFLKDDHFVVYGPSQFNALGLGTTQLYNRRTVFNRKRVGQFNLGGRVYRFHRWREAPKTLTSEFLVVELLNNLDDLAEDREQLLARLKSRLPEFNAQKLAYAVEHYGTITAKKRYEALKRKSISA